MWCHDDLTLVLSNYIKSCRRSNVCFVEVVENRSAAVLLDVLNKYVLPGTTVCWGKCISMRISMLRGCGTSLKEASNKWEKLMRVLTPIYRNLCGGGYIKKIIKNYIRHSLMQSALFIRRPHTMHLKLRLQKEWRRITRIKSKCLFLCWFYESVSKIF